MVIRLYGELPGTRLSQVLGTQFLRSGTSPGAHYREAYRAKSTADFISKIEGALQELEETMYWVELLTESGVIREAQAVSLLREAEELIAIFVASVRTAKANR